MTALSLGLIAALSWGLHDITIRYLSKTVPLMAALCVVLTVGAVFQASVIMVQGAPFHISFDAFWISVASGIAFLVASIGLYYAFQRGPVGLVAPLIASFPVLSLSFALIGGAAISPFQIAAVLLVVTGVIIVATKSQDNQDRIPPKGPTILLALMSSLGFASTFELGHMAASLAGEMASTLVARVTALVLLLMIMLLRRESWRIGPGALIPLATMGVLDGIALLSVISAASLPNPEFAAVSASTFGIFTIFLAWILLKERLGLMQVLGCAIAFTGIGYLSL